MRSEQSGRRAESGSASGAVGCKGAAPQAGHGFNRCGAEEQSSDVRTVCR